MKVKHFLLLVLLCVLVLNLAAYSGESKTRMDDATAQEEEVQVEVATPKETKSDMALGQVDAKEVVAIVNEEELKGEKYNAVLRSIYSKNQEESLSEDSAHQVRKQAMDTLVNQALILQQADASKIKVSEAEIEEAYELFVKQFKDENEMKEELDSKKIDVETVKEQIAESIKFKKYQNEVAPVYEVTEDEIEKYYEKVKTEANVAGQTPPPIHEIRDEIRELVIQEKQLKQFVAHIEKLKKNAKIEVNI